MCGIFAYTGNKKAQTIVLEGLKKLEYRGYDSAGLAYIEQDKIVVNKCCGRVSNLEEILDDSRSSIAIGHTRWATHGEVTDQNAHPHISEDLSIALVHNGIIENYEDIKKELTSVTFNSDTDSEVMLQAIAKHNKSSLMEGIFSTLKQLKGSYACVLLSPNEPDTLYAFTQESSLVIGVGEGENYVASDLHAFMDHTRKVIYLGDGEVAKITPNEISIFQSPSKQIKNFVEDIATDQSKAEKGIYEHFTLKEIFEQSKTLSQAFLNRIDDTGKQVVFEKQSNLDLNFLKGVQRIVILACGTSWHAACYASYLMEERLEIPVETHIASEFRYRKLLLQENTLIIAISQSGETADTLAAIKALKAKGAFVLSICNVMSSSISRLADATLFLRAGPEIGVCSTKAFTSQVVVLFLLSIVMEQSKKAKQDTAVMIEALKSLPEQVQAILDQSESIHSLAKRYSKYKHFFYLGRHYMFPCSLEGALKLKEITYINANAYPAGEMKHGPIALISDDCPTLAFCCNKHTYTKMVNNIKEIKARGGRVLAVAPEGDDYMKDLVDDIIFVPQTIDELMIVNASVASQLFAYYVALENGMNVDMPRNLAKSVTVE